MCAISAGIPLEDLERAGNFFYCSYQVEREMQDGKLGLFLLVEQTLAMVLSTWIAVRSWVRRAILS